jgi:hypothetical protein
MAIPAQNVAYSTAGPTASGQILAPNELTGLENAYQGLVTFVLDGATTSAVVNFIDGTKTLSFTPAAIDALIVGGTQNAATPIGVLSTKVTDNTKGTIFLSGAGTNANTIVVLVRIVK